MSHAKRWAPKNNAWPLAVALGVVYFVWGSTYFAIKVAVESFPPFFLTMVRFALAGVLLYGFLRLRGEPNPTRCEWLGSLLLGTLLLGGGTGLVTVAEAFGVSSGLAAVVFATMPLWLTLFVRLGGGRIGGLEWLGLGLGLSGVVILNLGADLWANPFATVLLFLAPLSWALGSFLSPKIAQPAGLMASATEMLTASVLFALIAAVRGESFAGAPSLRSSLALLYLVTFGSLLAYSAYVYLMKRNTRPALLGSYAYVNPGVAVVLGVGILGEELTPSGMIGMGVILIGVVLAVTAKAKRKKP